ncbi:MAG: MarR family winged helix-turn-helix transcriptional regulator [Patulibacter sp.]
MDAASAHATTQSSPPASDSAALASALRQAVHSLTRRFRGNAILPIPQLQALGLIARLGPRTTSQLAAHERMRPQSMAQTVGQLEAAGLVERRPDPADGRQQLVSLTAQGDASLAEFRRAADAWAADALTTQLSAAERAQLAAAVPLLLRLADGER